jgi:NDP-sugar pyrophosphorylase family protein
MYSQESSPLGTAGALRLALPLLGSANVLVLNGDSFSDGSLGDFWTWHCARGADATLLLAHVAETSRYGCVHVDDEGRVLRFAEKDGTSGSGWINAGVYLIERRLLKMIPADRAVSLEREMFPVWMSERLYGHQTSAAFLDIGTPESLALAADIFASTVPA